MHREEFVQTIANRLKDVKGVKAIVLGGSWASGTQRPDSDIDLGLYYSDDSPLDIQHIREIATELNDFSNPVVTDIEGWGKWVNGGAWLTIRGQRVDFLYRSIDFVSKIIDDCNRGEIQFDGMQQPPYGFHSYMYCAETQICQIVYDPIGAIQKLKAKVVHYSQRLKNKIINGFVWDARFSLEVAKKPAIRGEVYFVAGCLTRIISDLVQVLYAFNETYFISDKRLYKDEEQFSIKPKNFTERIDQILGGTGHEGKMLVETISATETLLEEVVALCGDQYIPKNYTF